MDFFNVYDSFIIPEEEMMPKEMYLKMYDTIGAAMNVFNELGRGMEEPIYQEALQKELEMQSIPFEREKKLQIYYKGELLEKYYIADFMTYNEILVELKSVSEISSVHRSQLFNYLRITKKKCGVLINYGDDSFYSERYWYIPSVDDFALIRKNNLSRIVKS